MKKIALSLVFLAASGCGSDAVEDAPDCVQTNVLQADSCGDGTVACQGTGPRESIWYCRLNLRHGDGTGYTALCVPECMPH